MTASTKSMPAKAPSATIGFEANLWLAADKLSYNKNGGQFCPSSCVVRCLVVMLGP